MTGYIDWHAVGMAILHAPRCYRCDKLLPVTPVTAEDDPLHRQWCSEECLDSSAEASRGAFTDIEYSSERGTEHG